MYKIQPVSLSAGRGPLRSQRRFELVITARRAADLNAFRRSGSTCARVENWSFCVPERIRSLAAAALGVRLGLVAYRSGVEARLSCLSWIRVT